MVAIAAIAVLFFWTRQMAFDCGSCSRQVAVIAAPLRSADFLSTNVGTTFTCGAAAGSYLTLFSTLSTDNMVTAATINWAGQNNSYSLAAGSTCLVGPYGSARETQNLLFAPTTNLLTTATAGGTFRGTVALASGAVLIFTGTFS